MSSREFNNHITNSNTEKAIYTEKDLVKLLKLTKLVKNENHSMMPMQPFSQQYQYPYPIQPPYMPQPHQSYQELTKDERDEVRRMIYKSNDELEENLKNFIMSNQKKFLLYIKELLDYQSTVKTAENIQVKNEEEKEAEETPQSPENVVDSLKKMPSNIGSMFSNVTSTISGVVQSANSMFTGKKTEPTTTTTTPTTTPTTPTTTPTTPTTTPNLSIDNVPRDESPSSNDNELDEVLKKNTIQPTIPPVTTTTSEIAQLKESNKKAEEQLNQLKREMKNLVPAIKQKGGSTLKNKKKNKSKNKKNSKRKIRKSTNLV
jgi:hypothetical protein